MALSFAGDLLLPRHKEWPVALRAIIALAQSSRTEHHAHMTPALKIVVEKHSDGYVAYPLGLARGAVVGQGDSYEEALSDVRSAIAFHIETFGAAALAPVGWEERRLVMGEPFEGLS